MAPGTSQAHQGVVTLAGHGWADPAAGGLLSEMWRTNLEWQQTPCLLREETIGVIGEVIAAGVAAGDFPADLDVRLPVPDAQID